MQARQVVGLTRLVQAGVRDIDARSLAVMAGNYAYKAARHRFRVDTAVPLVDLISLEVTHACERRCRGCYVPVHLRKDPALMSERVLHSAVAQGKEIGVRTFIFIGGEPMQESTIPMTLEVASRNQSVTFSYCTNADYIAQNDVSFFTRHPNISFFLSMDGFKETNDSIRGVGSYGNVVMAARQLRMLRRFVCANVTVRRENADEILNPDFVSHLMSMGFNAVMWLHGKAREGFSSALMVPLPEVISRLAKLREETLHLPFFQQTTFVGDFVDFGRDSAYHCIHVGVNGDLRIFRADMQVSSGNIKQTPMREVMARSDEVLSGKYSEV